MNARYEIPGYARCYLEPTENGWRVIGPSGKTLKECRGTTDGRPVYNLTRDNGSQHVLQLGRIVLLAFAGPPPQGRPYALHRDGDPWNNDPANLYWGTPRDNNLDAVRHGRSSFSVGHPPYNRRKTRP